jgi:hypothetical protein
MSIRYVLFENNLTSDPDDYMARVQPVDTRNLEAVIQRMIQGGSTTTRPDILSVLDEYVSAVESMVLEGMNVNTPLANYRTSIQGVFTGPEDSYDPSRHQVGAVVSPGGRFRDTVRNRAQVVKGEVVKPKPNLVSYTDVSSQARDSVLTPGGFGKLTGHRLKFDSAVPDQGIFFVASDGNTTRVETIGHNKPAELMFLVPNLTAGDYALEIRAGFGESEIRTGMLEATLTVA